MIKDTMERDMINEISTLFVMIFMSGLMFVMPMLDIECDDIAIIIGSGIILSFILTIIPILLSYDIRNEIIELIEDLDNQIVVDTSVYKRIRPRNYLGQVVCYFLLTYLSIRSIDSLAPSSSSNRLR